MGQLDEHPAPGRRGRSGRLPILAWAGGLVAAGALAFLILGTGLVPTAPTRSTAPDRSAAPTASTAPGGGDTPAASAADLLATLPVKGRAPATGYDRTGEFGPAWSDVDHNGCDTRNDILVRDLVDAVRRGPCTVLTGTLHDPYTGRTIAFVRGDKTSALVQIDHVVALQNAWVTGAQQLSDERRLQLANDPRNLMAAEGEANQQKGSGDAATWLPRNTSFRCEYVARQITVKAGYGLWVTQAEHDAMARVLARCPSQPVASAQPSPPAAPSSPLTAYASCAAARAAGHAPLHAGDPGYSRSLDGDGDGVACE